MSTKFVCIAVAVLAVLIVVGAVLSSHFLTSSINKEIFEITLTEEKTEAVEFNDLRLLPGEEAKYTVLLTGKATDKYNVEIVFSEKAESPLKDYVYVEITFEKETICSKPLSELLAGEALILSLDLKRNEKKNLEIIYRMPDEIGNEAQSASADFELLITSTNKTDES